MALRDSPPGVPGLNRSHHVVGPHTLGHMLVTLAELTEEELTARHVARLCAFVVRLRRVEGHALVRDKKFVQQVAEGTFQVTVTEGEGAASIRSVLPESEELLESATARVRPLVLKSEPTHGLSAIGALRYLLRGQDGFAEGG